MKKYELINPSDKIYFDAPSPKVALIAVNLLSPAYGAIPIDGRGEHIPIMMLQNFDEYFAGLYGKKLNTDDLFKTRLGPEVAVCLESFQLGHERSSMNDICGHAHEMAKYLRKKFELVE